MTVAAAGLWCTGDLIGQMVEKRSHPEKEFEYNRLLGTTVDGAVMGGMVGYVWYNLLDRVVSSCVSAGTARFVLAKVTLEFLVFHPISLYVFWQVVGRFEGHDSKQIAKELESEYLPTLGGEYLLWTPIDVLNFWKVPVRYQVLFVNCGSLLEAVFLSLSHGGDHDDGDKIQEGKSSASKYRATFLDGLLKTEKNIAQVMAHAKLQFEILDLDHNGFLSLEELQKCDNLPGITDRAVNAKVIEILYRKADVDGDGRVTEKVNIYTGREGRRDEKKREHNVVSIGISTNAADSS